MRMRCGDTLLKTIGSDLSRWQLDASALVCTRMYRAYIVVRALSLPRLVVCSVSNMSRPFGVTDSAKGGNLFAAGPVRERARARKPRDNGFRAGAGKGCPLYAWLD
jgi:hypothetical protein